ncbi:hypothetical protein BpHYR1_002938 [Brachionus plicatilis]|uniref:Uncharacterized protein n=1 Tax=Brachionus plicatilis TaxID=10195 RepID=A0A3M7T4H2_BRAPC|nr:hypothetical protein BpHYR1_002938 [Brachionus plicatilis]
MTFRNPICIYKLKANKKILIFIMWNTTRAAPNGLRLLLSPVTVCCGQRSLQITMEQLFNIHKKTQCLTISTSVSIRELTLYFINKLSLVQFLTNSKYWIVDKNLSKNVNSLKKIYLNIKKKWIEAIRINTNDVIKIGQQFSCFQLKNSSSKKLLKKNITTTVDLRSYPECYLLKVKHLKENEISSTVAHEVLTNVKSRFEDED